MISGNILKKKKSRNMSWEIKGGGLELDKKFLHSYSYISSQLTWRSLTIFTSGKEIKREENLSQFDKLTLDCYKCVNPWHKPSHINIVTYVQSNIEKCKKIIYFIRSDLLNATVLRKVQIEEGSRPEWLEWTSQQDCCVRGLLVIMSRNSVYRNF